MNKTLRISLRTALIVVVCGCATAGAAFAGGDPSAWMNPQPEQPEVIVVRGATVWTSGPDGILENADLLIKKGKIAAIGENLKAPSGAVEIDGAGKHVTPGLIDAHSHSAIVGGLNESTNNITAEVRIGDVVNSDTIAIYRELAGCLTTANQLHGSANSIGGHNAVMKLRWGASPQDMIFDAAPQGIKFALGENPKQSNWGADANNRYPQTRQGVERSIRERFEAARDYREARASSSMPVRRDLQLDAVVEILEGERLVHSHSYRADEILMLLGVAEDFGFKVSSFQHVLEGYKVADELAAAEAGASTFSDWWAYKYEVVDAIPHNGAVMWERGVVTSFNSDSSELSRRLNLEAAKAVRYGGVPPAEALKFVTLNPAIQLGIEDHVGSLEVGKDADFSVWSGSPLSTYTVCEQTWIDGRKYFDREEDLKVREEFAAERQALMDKVRALESEEEESDDETESDEAEPTEETDEEPEESR